MAPVPKPIDYMKQIPPRQAFEELVVGMEAFRKHKEVEHQIKELHTALSLYDKVFAGLLKDIEKQAKQPEPRSSAHADLKALASRFKTSLDTMEKYLVRENLGDELQKAKDKYKTYVVLAEALVVVAAKSKVAVIKALGSDLESICQAYKAVAERVAEGGHPFFDAETAKAGRELWLTLDHAYDEYAFQLKRAGSEFDPIYAKRPLQASPLRPRLLMVDPTVSSAPPKAKGKTGGTPAAPAAKKGSKKKAPAPAGGQSASGNASNASQGHAPNGNPAPDSSGSDEKPSK
jgi:hypothetical protein